MSRVKQILKVKFKINNQRKISHTSLFKKVKFSRNLKPINLFIDLSVK